MMSNGPCSCLQVVPQRLALDFRPLDVRRVAEHMDVPKSFALQSAQRTPQLLRLIPDHVRPEVSIRPIAIPLLAYLFREIENNRHGQHMELARKLDQRFARLRLHVCRIDHRQPAQREPLPRDEMKNLECFAGHGLVVFIVRNQATAEVGRQNLSRLEMRARER